MKAMQKRFALDLVSQASSDILREKLVTIEGFLGGCRSIGTNQIGDRLVIAFS